MTYEPAPERRELPLDPVDPLLRALRRGLPDPLPEVQARNRRRYEEYLDLWIAALEDYQRYINALFDIQHGRTAVSSRRCGLASTEVLAVTAWEARIRTRHR